MKGREKGVSGRTAYTICATLRALKPLYAMYILTNHLFGLTDERAEEQFAGGDHVIAVLCDDVTKRLTTPMR